MRSYRLIATRQNADGSWELPFVDVVFSAENAEAAALEAGKYPLESFLEHRPRAWLSDDQGRVVADIDVFDLPQAA